MKAAEIQINHTKDRLWSYDTELICTVSNQLMRDDYETAFGKKLEPGIHILDGVPEPIYSMWLGRYKLALQGKPVEFVDTFEMEGVPSYVEVSMFPIIENGEVKGVACTSRDITIRKKAELKLAKNEANLIAQIENTNDSIWSIDSDFRVLTVNIAMASNFEMAFQHRLMVGDNMLDVLPAALAPLWQDRYQRVLNGEHYSFVDQFEFEKLPQYIEVSFNPIKVGEEIVGAACFSKDITKLKLSEIELQKSLEFKNKFFSIVAHDLRGPMGNIRQLVNLIADNSGALQDDQKVIATKFLSEATEDAYILLDNLLEWGLTQRNMVELTAVKLDVKELIADSIAAHLSGAKTKNIATTIEVFDDALLCADKRTIGQVLSNLFGNAVKFTDSDGQITVLAVSYNEGVQFTIKDNGRGMEPEIVKQLFVKNGQLNVSTIGTKKEKGTGLGLLLCQEFVHLNGGEIWVESELGKGSAFHFKIPNCKKV